MSSPLILLVDDQVEFRTLMTLILEEAGYAVIQATSGIETLRTARTRPPDLLISDVFMPGMDGYELVRRMRGEPLLSAIPVILTSGVFNDEAAMQLAKGFGVRHFLTKPILREKLLGSVADALSSKEAMPLETEEQQEREHNRLLVDKLIEKVRALEASEERFRQLVETAVTIVLYLSPQFRILALNSEAERVFTRKRSEVLGRDFVQLFIPQCHHEAAIARLRKALAGEPTRGFECLTLGGDGSEKHVSWNLNRGQGRPGQPDGIIAIGLNITEQKRVENALTESEARYRQLVELSPDAIFVNREGRFVFVNKAAIELLRAKGPEDLIGRLALDFVHPDYREEADRNIKQMLHENAPNVRAKRKMIRLDGTVVDVESVKALLRFENNDALQIVVRDITEQKRAEREIAARARQQQVVAELGQRALGSVSLKALFDETTVLVAGALEVGFCKVLELAPDKSGLKLVAGVGWREGLVGQAVVGSGLDSQAGYTLHRKGPVIVEDLSRETRFHGPPLLHDHGIVSGVSVIIGDESNPWGVLGVHVCRKRIFTADNIAFLQSVANVLAAAISRVESDKSLHDLSGRLMQAEDAERRRIAKELHDSTAQDLVAVMMNLESMRDSAAAQNHSEVKQLEDSIALVENCAHEIRTLSYVLHPPRLDEAGLGEAIRYYAAGFGERTGITTRVDLPLNLQRLGEPVEMALFRVVQECLGNIHRHARSVTALIHLEHDASGTVLEVRDEGQGIPPLILEPNSANFTGFGVGIPGMKERLRQIGGRLEIESGPHGTIVRAVVAGGSNP